jgi:copper(I)-binding protein
MNILNGSSVADTLISLSSPVAGMAEVHETYEQEEGMMGMRPAETIVVPARDALSLEPGGLHVMLMQLNRELTEGDSLEFTLNFTHAGHITLTAPVQTMNK